jgi:hypothetical protein
VYRPDGAYGGTGRYGFDSRAHLTEKSRLLTTENIARLHQSWHSYWDPAKSICVEKTPGNLIMTRFLQAAFPNSYFIVVKRHPVPVSMATQRWKVSLTSLHRLFEHWLKCYDLYEEDKKHLVRVYELNYEDYIATPDRYHQEMASFMGTRPPADPLEEVTDAHNRKYFDKWTFLLTRSRFKRYYRYVAEKYDPMFARYGYSLLDSLNAAGDDSYKKTQAFTAFGGMYCFGADVGALMCRGVLQTKWAFMRQLRARLPECWKIRIKRFIGKESLSNKTAHAGR